MNAPYTPFNANRLLAEISADAYARLAPHLVPVELERGDTLQTGIGPVNHL